MFFILFFQTCLISPICVGKWPNFASSRLFTDLGRTSSARLTFQRETFPACRCCSRLYILPCSVFVQHYQTKPMPVWFTVFRQPSEWGGDPAEVPAASGAGGQRDRSWSTPGIVPPYCLESLLASHSSQCHTRLQHRHRSVTRRLKCISLWICRHLNDWKLWFCAVILKWRLHFEFVTAREPLEPPTVLQNQSEVTLWTGTEHVDVDTFSWDLPIKVLPTNPALASYMSHFTGSNSINIWLTNEVRRERERHWFLLYRWKMF